jgi:hypothetical protein
MHQPVRSSCARLQRLTNPARRDASLPLAVRPRPATRPADRTAVSLVVEEPSGADRDDVIDLVGPPPASRTPNLADAVVTLEDSLPDPPPMAVIAEAAVLTDTHVSPFLLKIFAPRGIGSGRVWERVAIQKMEWGPHLLTAVRVRLTAGRH